MHVSMQVPPQSTRPMRQAQAPATHERPIGQAVPQVPQLFCATMRFTQVVPQRTCPLGQSTVHCPEMQT